MPIALKTRRKASGRSQAAVNAAMAPLLEPAMARSLPSLREPDRPAVRRGLRLHLGEELVQQEPGVVVAEAVVLVAAVEAIERLVGGRLHAPVHDEHADDDRHLPLVDELVEDGGRVELDAVLVDVHAGRLGRVVLLRHVDPVVAHRAGEDLAPVEGVLRDLPLRHVVRADREGRRDRQGDQRSSDKARGRRMGGILESVDSIPGGIECVRLPAAPEDQSPSVSQPLRYSRRTNRFASRTLVTFRSPASHSRVVSGNRVARHPSRTDSVSGPE